METGSAVRIKLAGIGKRKRRLSAVLGRGAVIDAVDAVNVRRFERKRLGRTDVRRIG